MVWSSPPQTPNQQPRWTPWPCMVWSNPPQTPNQQPCWALWPCMVWSRPPQTLAESDGTSTPTEGKGIINFWDNLDQVVSTCVTYSFTEHSLHIRMNPLVPTILMNTNSMRVCLYDCQHDILFLSAER